MSRAPRRGGGRGKNPSPSPNQGPRTEAGSAAAPTELREDEAGALQIGVTDQNMVRLIVTTHSGVAELDFEPDEAADIAGEITAAAERARRGA